jgi:hypothetical protein
MFADVASRIFDRRNWMLKPSMHLIAPSHLRHDRRYASSVRPSSRCQDHSRNNQCNQNDFFFNLPPACMRPATAERCSCART